MGHIIQGHLIQWSRVRKRERELNIQEKHQGHTGEGHIVMASYNNRGRNTTVTTISVLPGPDKHSRPPSPKTTGIFEAFTAIYQKICRCMIFQSTTTIKNLKKHNVLSFFVYAPHFWIEYYSNFLNLTKFVSQHLIATHGHFHRHQFLTANYFFTACFDLFSGDHGHLAIPYHNWFMTTFNAVSSTYFLHFPRRNSPMSGGISHQRNDGQ